MTIMHSPSHLSTSPAMLVATAQTKKRLLSRFFSTNWLSLSHGLHWQVVSLWLDSESLPESSSQLVGRARRPPILPSIFPFHTPSSCQDPCGCKDDSGCFHGIKWHVLCSRGLSVQFTLPSCFSQRRYWSSALGAAVDAMPSR
jgi:hypothetical protein